MINLEESYDLPSSKYIVFYFNLGLSIKNHYKLIKIKVQIIGCKIIFLDILERIIKSTCTLVSSSNFKCLAGCKLF